jgi:hypothetical protein
MSETNEPIIAGLVLSKLSTMQVSVSGDHVERSYDSQVKPNRSKTVEIENSPVLYL